MSTTAPATSKQINYLLMLANRKYGTQAKYLSQVRTELGLSSSAVGRITKAQASALIDNLK